jgi:hypothetical protein
MLNPESPRKAQTSPLDRATIVAIMGGIMLSI